MDELRKEFEESLSNCLSGHLKDRWVSIIEMLNSDHLFEEANLSTGSVEEILKTYDTLSSGHKVILLTITKLVESTNERTLVLIDEPENHLHPPLLASFIRALSSLLIQRNGVAIIATHSPIVLQEIPKDCVSILDRVGNEFAVRRPSKETFGENVSILTHEVFSLEVKNSGFYALISANVKAAIDEYCKQNDVNPSSSSEEKASASSAIYKIIEDKFNKKLGGEARILARVMIMQGLRDDKDQ